MAPDTPRASRVAHAAAAAQLAQDAARSVDRAIALAAFRGERILSIARLLFCLATLARALQFTADPAQGVSHALVSGPSMLVAIGFSLYMIRRGWRRHEQTWLLTASTAVDALVCFAALVPNSLWPGGAYGGVLRVPDTSALLIITAVSGVRLSPRAAVWSAGLNAASLSVLIAIDVARLRVVYPDDAGQLSLFVIYLGAAAAIAIIVAVRTRRLVAEGAQQAVMAEQARHRLHTLLQDHHDVRTVLSSATLNADLAAQSASRLPDARSDAELRERLDQVREDLRHVGHFVAAVREEAQEELRFQREPVSVDVAVVMATLLPLVRRQFAGVVVSFDSSVSNAFVAVGGGAETLERVLLNLLVNACEGNGAARATRVRVQVDPAARPDWLQIAVRDNGPGFPPAALALCGERAFSTKSGGTGVGLLLTASLLRANGSRLECLNEGGGGVARFELPHVGAGRTGPLGAR